MLALNKTLQPLNTFIRYIFWKRLWNVVWCERCLKSCKYHERICAPLFQHAWSARSWMDSTAAPNEVSSWQCTGLSTRGGKETIDSFELRWGTTPTYTLQERIIFDQRLKLRVCNIFPKTSKMSDTSNKTVAFAIFGFPFRGFVLWSRRNRWYKWNLWCMEGRFLHIWLR